MELGGVPGSPGQMSPSWVSGTRRPSRPLPGMRDLVRSGWGVGGLEEDAQCPGSLTLRNSCPRGAVRSSPAGPLGPLLLQEVGRGRLPSLPGGTLDRDP